MRKPRKPEAAAERDERRRETAQRRSDEAAEADQALDAMVRRSIRDHGA